MESFMKQDNNIPEIDFVITWVDGNDPDWQKQKMEYSMQPDLSQKQDDRKERYRDWDLLRYWFRGVERFAPWVRRIHFVTWGHLPSWLNKEHPKLNIVNHKDFIPKNICRHLIHMPLSGICTESQVWQRILYILMMICF